MRIAIDANGGDNAPEAVLDGIKLALASGLKADIVIYGDETVLSRKFLDNPKYDFSFEIVNCDEYIEDTDKPVAAIRQKKNSSIVRACQDLKDKKIDAFVSCGNTGALLSAGTLITGRIKGIKRPALTTVYPTEKGFAVLADVGANASSSPSSISDFALMASLYSKKILDLDNPEVKLLNIGAEEAKGSELYQEAHALLKANEHINFKGNIEARDLLRGDCDVVVCDGFTGNIALKLVEGAASSIFKLIKAGILKSFKAKLGAVLMSGTFRELKNKLDSSAYGGAPLLGVNGALVKAHGSSDKVAIMNALKYADKYAESGLVAELERLIREERSKNGSNEKDEQQ